MPASSLQQMPPATGPQNQHLDLFHAELQSLFAIRVPDVKVSIEYQITPIETDDPLPQRWDVEPCAEVEGRPTRRRTIKRLQTTGHDPVASHPGIAIGISSQDHHSDDCDGLQHRYQRDRADAASAATVPNCLTASIAVARRSPSPILWTSMR